MNQDQQSTEVFESAYIRLRRKENRVLTIQEVAALPYPLKGPHMAEWKMRAQSAARFIQYLTKKSQATTLVEIGCGNGWFSHLIAAKTTLEVVGIDINQSELLQAKQLFENPKCQFIEFDLYQSNWTLPKPDIIVFNASIQYFSNLRSIIQKAKDLLNINGELHILDTSFYSPDKIEDAKQRSMNYFSNMGVPEMIQYYFHHSLPELLDCNPTFHYLPKKFPLNKIIKDSPFYWISIKKTNE